MKKLSLISLRLDESNMLSKDDKKAVTGGMTWCLESEGCRLGGHQCICGICVSQEQESDAGFCW